MVNLEGLYLITDEILTPKQTLFSQVEKALKAGVRIIQLRDKTRSDEELEEVADFLQTLCVRYDALFVMNDRVELAINNRLEALHVGESDYARLPYIRENFHGILGVSCYGDLTKAKELETLGVDYVAFGSFYPSKTKPNSKVVDKNILLEAKQTLEIPICAIGGIVLENLEDLLFYKPDMIAVINDIWIDKNIEEKIKNYNQIIYQKESV